MSVKRQMNEVEKLLSQIQKDKDTIELRHKDLNQKCLDLNSRISQLNIKHNKTIKDLSGVLKWITISLLVIQAGTLILLFV